MKKNIKDMEELFEQYIKNEITAKEFEQKRQQIDKKYGILAQEKFIKSIYFSIFFNVIAVIVCGFVAILNIFNGNIGPLITNGLLTIFNSINLIFNIKKLNKSKLKLIKDCLI